MLTTNYPHYIFWSYKPTADLSEELIAEQVILYGDLEDIFRVSKELKKEVIEKATDRIAASGHWKKRVNFMNKIILKR